MSVYPELLVGQTLRVPVEFRIGDTLVDPTDVKFLYEIGGTVTALVFGTDDELIKEATGKYYLDLLIDAPGIWKWRFEGSDDSIGWATQGRFIAVKADPIEPVAP